MKSNTLVKYDYDSLPLDWKKGNPNEFKGVHFIFLGEIPNQLNHASCISLTDNKVYIFSMDSIKELTEDEL